LPDPKLVRARAKLDAMSIDIASENHSCIREVERWCRDVENGNYGKGRSNPDEIKCDGKDHYEPDGINWCLSVGVDFGPETEDASAKESEDEGKTYPENGRAPSREKA
jgi:hypothetical protein